jgi:hypothetical protein
MSVLTRILRMSVRPRWSSRVRARTHTASRSAKYVAKASKEQGLILCDSQHAQTAQSMDRAVKIDLGMQSISRTDPAKQREARKQRLSNRDLSGVLGNLDLEHCLVALMGTKGEHMRRMVLGCPDTTHRLAITSKRIIRQGVQRGSYPISTCPFDLLCIQARKQCAVQGIAGTQKSARSEQVREEIVLLTAPLPNGHGRVIMAEERGNHTGEQKGQFRAQSMRGAWIRKGSKEFGETQERILLASILTAITGQ